MAGLQISDLSKSFGGIVALDRVSFEVRPGEITGLIGPNGAGKTTVFNCISRLYDPDHGSILFDGHDLVKMSPHDIVNVGIARTFQNVELFRTM
ncbi:MAG: ATP-binding cassette domain-containing protein, partial [Chloroflexota bacterium]|nr:ATP-binding cassette domain-containing protein [Chloroflexota bacterium]